LTFRGFAAGDAGERGLCHLESARVAQNATPVSGLVKLFPGGIPAREQRRVRMSAETAFESVEASAGQLAAYIPGSAFGGATTLLLQNPRSFALLRGPSYLG
jgi:hypothetical protein